jgi:hypothetical protein
VISRVGLHREGFPVTIDRNDGIAKLINALTGAICAFKQLPGDTTLRGSCEEALTYVLKELPERTGGSVDSFELRRDDARLIPWQPQARLVEDTEKKEWIILVDSVDIGSRFPDWVMADSAFWAVSNAIDRMCKYGRSAAEGFYREQLAQ